MMDKLKKYGARVALALFALVFSAVAVRSVTGIDFVEGTKIPATLTADYTLSGDNTHSGLNTFSGGTIKTPTASTGATTLSDAVDSYIFDTSGGAITVTCPDPSTLTLGKTWKTTLKTAGNAVTFNAGTFSINGAVTDANMDAAGDSFEIMNVGTGYVFTSRYIH